MRCNHPFAPSPEAIDKLNAVVYPLRILATIYLQLVGTIFAFSLKSVSRKHTITRLCTKINLLLISRFSVRLRVESSFSRHKYGPWRNPRAFAFFRIATNCFGLDLFEDFPSSGQYWILINGTVPNGYINFVSASLFKASARWARDSERSLSASATVGPCLEFNSLPVVEMDEDRCIHAETDQPRSPKGICLSPTRPRP